LKLGNIRGTVEHYAKAVEGEAARLPFLPHGIIITFIIIHLYNLAHIFIVINQELKLHLTFEVKYFLETCKMRPPNVPWHKIDHNILKRIEGENANMSLARACFACNSMAKTKVCQKCRVARYCSVNCQVQTFTASIGFCFFLIIWL
jgi:radical SAM protein with 4Fe4S-binding SPASM domain